MILQNDNKSFFIMASGNGSNAEALVRHALKVKMKLQGLICDRTDAFVLERMKKLKVPTWCIPLNKGDREEHENKILKVIEKEGKKYKKNQIWIFLAGYKRLLSSSFLKRFYDPCLKRNRVVNIHPSILPKFPGPHGYRDAFQAEEKESGCTVHFVNEGMDTGVIILQEKFNINSSWDLDTIKSTGLKIEHQIYPKVLDMVREGSFHESL